MSDQVKAEKPKKSKSKILRDLAAIGVGIWAVIKALSGQNDNGQNKS